MTDFPPPNPCKPCVPCAQPAACAASSVTIQEIFTATTAPLGTSVALPCASKGTLVLSADPAYQKQVNASLNVALTNTSTVPINVLGTIAVFNGSQSGQVIAQKTLSIPAGATSTISTSASQLLDLRRTLTFTVTAVDSTQNNSLLHVTPTVPEIVVQVGSTFF